MKRSFIFIIFFLIISASSQGKYHIPSLSDLSSHHGKYSKSGALNPKKIKLLVWNIYKGEKEEWQRDYLDLSKDKDVVLLQEAHSQAEVLELFNRDEFAYEMFSSFWYSKSGREKTGVANGSKVAPRRFSFRRSMDREPIIKTPKMIGISEFSLSGTNKEIAFVNIHALNFVSTKKLTRHLDQIETYAASWKGYLVVAGDFNTWSKKKTRALFAMVKRLKMREVKFDPEEDERMEVFGNKLDYIFTRGLKHSRPKVHGKLQGSDHKAMSVELSIN